MNARFAFDVLSSLAETDSVLGPIVVKVGSPILLKNGAHQTAAPDVWRLFGIYFLLEAKEGAWDVPFEQNEGEIWYVGKTSSNLHERMKSHFQLKNMQSTFENHRWRSVTALSETVQESLGKGAVVVYPVQVLGSGHLNKLQKSLLPEIVEKHLLLAFVHVHGRLPVLNLQL